MPCLVEELITLEAENTLESNKTAGNSVLSKVPGKGFGGGGRGSKVVCRKKISNKQNMSITGLCTQLNGIDSDV